MSVAVAIRPTVTSCPRHVQALDPLARRHGARALTAGRLRAAGSLDRADGPGSHISAASLKHGTRGAVTRSTADPTAQRSPMRASVVDPLDRQVLAELGRGQRPAELLRPPRGVLGGVGVDGLERAAVIGAIGLLVPREAVRPDRDGPGDGSLDDRGAPDLRAVRSGAAATDVDAEDAAGHAGVSLGPRLSPGRRARLEHGRDGPGRRRVDGRGHLAREAPRRRDRARPVAARRGGGGAGALGRAGVTRVGGHDPMPASRAPGR